MPEQLSASAHDHDIMHVRQSMPNAIAHSCLSIVFLC